MEMGTEWVYIDCVYLQRTLDCPEIPLIRKTGWGTTERKERQMDRKREKGEGGCTAFKKEEDTSLIDVENV